MDPWKSAASPVLPLDISWLNPQQATFKGQMIHILCVEPTEVIWGYCTRQGGSYFIFHSLTLFHEWPGFQTLRWVYANPPHFAASLGGRKYFPKTIVVHKVSVEKQLLFLIYHCRQCRWTRSTVMLVSHPSRSNHQSSRSPTVVLQIHWRSGWWFKPTKFGINAPQPVPSPVIFLGYYHTWRKNWDLKMTIINHHLGKMT